MTGEECHEAVQFALRYHRRLERLCPGCAGWGKRVYPSTATWKSQPGKVAGQALTPDVCDECWGSGDATTPWPSWRKQ